MTTDNLIRVISLIGIILLLFIIAGNPVFAAEQLMMQTDAPWWATIAGYKFEIMVTIGSCIAGYIAGQHYKNHPKVEKNNGFAIASFNGLVTGSLATWMLSNKYQWNESIQGGVMLALCSPVIIWLLFLIIDRFFPGKADILKSGIYIEVASDKTQLTKFVAAAIVGKKKDRRTRTDNEVWTHEQREAHRNGQD